MVQFAEVRVIFYPRQHCMSWSKTRHHHLMRFVWLRFAPRFLFVSQDLAQVKTPPNVKMISTSPSELAWMLAGVVYPADADEYPEKYVSDFRQALTGHLTELQTKPRNARAMAARFIQTLLSKVRSRLEIFAARWAWFVGGGSKLVKRRWCSAGYSQESPESPVFDCYLQV